MMLKEHMQIMKQCSMKDTMVLKLMKTKKVWQELARMNLILNTPSMVLENRFIKPNESSRLRADHHAQYEIRVYADIMLDTLKKCSNNHDALQIIELEELKLAKGKLLFKNLSKVKYLYRPWFI